MSRRSKHEKVQELYYRMSLKGSVGVKSTAFLAIASALYKWDMLAVLHKYDILSHKMSLLQSLSWLSRLLLPQLLEGCPH